MKSTGFGTFIYEICIHVDAIHIPLLKNELNIDPFFVDGDKGSASYIIEIRNRKRGDDESVVWELMHIIPKDVLYVIDWTKSDYS